MKSSRLKGFYKLQRGARLDSLRDFCQLPTDQLRVMGQDGALGFELTDLFIENAIGNFPMPVGVATSFKINNRDYVLPMAVEESSVIAAASNAARIVYECGGFTAECLSSQMIGQIQLLDIEPRDFERVEFELMAAKEHLLRIANEIHPRLVMRGGGARDIEVRKFPRAEIPMMVLHVLLDTRDAMGANLVNTVCERLAPEIENITKARVGLRILSNLADRRLFRSRCRVNPELLSVKDPQIAGDLVAARIQEACVFANTDPYRAATHNKGIMNGIDPVCIATGNDWRAIEAGAHAYAARDGRYASLTRWRVGPDGWLEGSIELPLQLGTVGGVTRLHPVAKLCLQLLGNPHTKELGMIIASAGLAANLAALKALATTGIQKGHMRLHAKNLALAAGAKGAAVEWIAHKMLRLGTINGAAAENLLEEYQNEHKRAATTPHDAVRPS